jgi:hypothetical protein
MMSLMPTGRPWSGPPARVDGARPGDGPVRIEMRPGVKARLLTGDAFEAGADQRLGGDLAVAEPPDGRRCAELLEGFRAHRRAD